ncbi:MAG: hypothetical protein WCT10_05190 [Patescibacteria group bacterium]|jgi:hypothetical protein
MRPDKRSNVSSQEAAAKPLPVIVIGLGVGIVLGGIAFGICILIGDLDIALTLSGAIFVIVTLASSGGESSDRTEKKLAADWQEVAQGVFDRVEYVPRGRYHHLATVVYYDDGRACVLTDAVHDIDFPRGTKIVVERNKLYDYRIKVQK